MSHRSIARPSAGRGQKRRAGEANTLPSTQPLDGAPEAGLQENGRYGYWSDGEQALLLQWLGLSGNFEKWKCAGIRNAEKKNRTSSMPKKSMASLISDYLKDHHVIKSVDQVLNKMRYVEDKYKDAKDFLHATGEGLSTEDEKMAVSTIRDKVYQKCPFYDIINPIMRDSVSITLPYGGESNTVENISKILFNDSTLRGDFKSLVEDDYIEENGLEDEVEAAASEEYEENDTSMSQKTGAGESYEHPTQSPQQTNQSPQQPLQSSQHHAPSSLQHALVPQQSPGLSQQSMQPLLQPLQPPQGPRGSIPFLNPNVTRVNKKQKTIGEQVLELQKESHFMLEKKLEVIAEHHRQQLQFQREESEKRFILENRRMDLEKEELELRRLTLQLELERIRRST